MSLPKNSEDGKSTEVGEPLNRNPDESEPSGNSTPRCALLTGSGRSAIAVIGLRGPHSEASLNRCFCPASDRPLRPGEIRYGLWRGPVKLGSDSPESAAGESVVVTPIDAEHFEIHCHGGSAATSRILEDLQRSGAVNVTSTQWDAPTTRPLIAEANWVLQRCLTARTAAIALAQANGALQHWVLRWRDALDAAESSPPEARNRSRTSPPPATPPEATADAGQLRNEARRMLSWAAVTIRLHEPFRIVLIGPPNVGKSSLLNAMVGFQRSITWDEAGTTRDVLHADTVIDGLPVRLSDTAGMRQGGETIEQMGMQRAKQAAAQADLVLQVTEPTRLADPQAHQRDREILDAVQSRAPAIRLLNKADLQTSRRESGDYDLAVSALHGEGIEQLMQLVSNRLAAAIPDDEAAVILNQRQYELMQRIADSDNPAHMRHCLDQLLGSPLSSEIPHE